MKTCTDCKLPKENNDYYYKQGRCKKCFVQMNIQRQRNLKLKAIEYKGSKCFNCGYDKCIAALEFHHINSNEKEFSIAQTKSQSWSRIKPELDKCVLLCANCHREIHYL